MTTADVAVQPSTGTTATRMFAWGMIGATFAYVIENYLMFWQGWPSALSALSSGGQTFDYAIDVSRLVHKTPPKLNKAS